MEVANHPAAHALACIEVDRFCTGCGYNLRTLPVLRDERTGVLLVRCTECGKHHPANDGTTITQSWLHRLTSMVVVGWVLILLATYVLSGFLQGALMYGTLEELTGYNRSIYSTSGPGQITIINGRVVTTRTVNASAGQTPALTPRAYQPEYVIFLAMMLVFSCLLGAIIIGGATVVFPHWRRLAYVGMTPIVPLIVATVITLVWMHEAPGLFDWGLRVTAAHAGVHLVGGLLGAFAGRAAVRTIVRVMLPPGVRPRLAFLWLADGKQPPPARKNL